MQCKEANNILMLNKLTVDEDLMRRYYICTYIYDLVSRS